MNKAFWHDSALRKRLFVGALLVFALVMLISAMRHIRATEPRALPVLGLSTTLPLQWPEGGIAAALDETREPAPAFAQLASRYRIEAIDTPGQLSAKRVELLLMAQPRAFAPAELVAMDKWVRDGGRLMLLADPALQWESIYPLGDKRRPLFTSLLSPLFAHWGLELAIPLNEATSAITRELNDMTIRTVSPGEWQLRQSKAAYCVVRIEAMVADCKVGKGRAVLIADADLLDARFWEGSGVRALTNRDDFDNMQWILRELRALKRNKGFYGRKRGNDSVLRQSMGN